MTHKNDPQAPADLNDGLPERLRYDGKKQRYRYTVPGSKTKQRKWLGTDRAQAILQAERFNRYWALKSGRSEIRNEASATVSYAIELYRNMVVPTKAWAKSTRANRLHYLELYTREFGNQLLVSCQRDFLTRWLNERGGQGATRNLHRALLIDIWKYAISRSLVSVNEPEATYPANQSPRVKENRKRRKRLQLEEFLAIHDHKDTLPWLRRAMRLALITRQGRHEICAMQYPDEGYLYFTRAKTAERTDYAHMRIKVNAAIQQIIDESQDDQIECPYIIHAKPLYLRAEHRKSKLHWACITPDHLTKSFASARDAAQVGNGLPGGHKPTFHEIRSLGGRILESQGWSKEHISEAYGHTSLNMTEEYLRNDLAIPKHLYREVRIGLDMDTVRQL